MSDQTQSFGKIATILSHSPLGIIALFIVLVYGLASLLVIFGGDFTPTERLPFVYFLVFFPILLLGSFVWLVSEHGDKLVDPGQFKDGPLVREVSKRRDLKTADITSKIREAQATRGKEPTQLVRTWGIWFGIPTYPS